MAVHGLEHEQGEQTRSRHTRWEDALTSADESPNLRFLPENPSEPK